MDLKGKLPWLVIVQCAERYNLNPELVGAIILVESGGCRNAMRFEPHWDYMFEVEKFSKLLGCTEETEIFGQSTSWGYMQVMGTVARELGFKSWFPELCVGYTNIYYGTKKLNDLCGKYKNVEDVISSYNAGSVTKDLESKKYKNQLYVDRVLDYYYKLKGGK